jgi:hypothetical protein
MTLLDGQNVCSRPCCLVKYSMNVCLTFAAGQSSGAGKRCGGVLGTLTTIVRDAILVMNVLVRVGRRARENDNESERASMQWFQEIPRCMIKVCSALSTSSKNDSEERSRQDRWSGRTFRACLDCYTVTFRWIGTKAQRVETVHLIGLICVHIPSSTRDGFLVRAPKLDQKRFPRALAVNVASARQHPPKPPSPSSCQAPSPVVLPEYACTVTRQCQRHPDAFRNQRTISCSDARSTDWVNAMHGQ